MKKPIQHIAIAIAVLLTASTASAFIYVWQDACGLWHSLWDGGSSQVVLLTTPIPAPRATPAPTPPRYERPKDYLP